MNSQWEPTIGLEVHIQLKTKSKMFSGASAQYGAAPNRQACLIDLGFPGTLPVLNGEAVNMAIKFGLAIEGQIALRSVFARKNYFYPDLPKGYQISQHDKPIIQNGHLDIFLDSKEKKTITITRAHLEEDSGKMFHEEKLRLTGVDFNRAGIPLLEIVSAPEMHSAQEAVAYLKDLHTLVCYLDICSGNMQEGSFRCDVNVSVKPKHQSPLGTRTEIKNVNSFRFVEKAIQYEIKRQIEELSQGRAIQQETLLYDSKKNETRSMRIKESVHDYRYFPEPDLLPLNITSEMIESIKKILPELPQTKKERFIRKYSINAQEASILVTNRELGHYFEQMVSKSELPGKLCANWVLGELSAALNEHNVSVSQTPVLPSQLIELLSLIQQGKLSNPMAKIVFAALWKQEGTIEQIIERKGLKPIESNDEIQSIIESVLQDNQAEVVRYRNGEKKLFGFLVGQTMKAARGKANPQQINTELKRKLG